MKFCAEIGLCVGNTFHKYTTGARGQDGVEIKSMTDLVLVKRDILRYVQDVRVVRGMGQGLTDHHVVLYKVRLVGEWIKNRDMVAGARRIKSKRVKWDGDNNVEYMWEEVKWAMVESGRELWDSVRVGGKNPKSLW